MDGVSEPNPAVPGEEVATAGTAAAGEHVEAAAAPTLDTPTVEAPESVTAATDDDKSPKKGGGEEDDDVVVVEEQAPEPPPSKECPEGHADMETQQMSPTEATPTAEAAPPSEVTPPAAATPEASEPANPASAAEPIVIDDEEEPEKKQDDSSPSALSTMEPHSDIRIANVTTLGQKRGARALPEDAQADLLITSVTSLQGGPMSVDGAAEENGLQIGSAFSLTPDGTSKRPSASFNPGRSSAVQNGDAGTHNRTDSWISQSASVPRNQKQTGVDSSSTATSLPKPPGQSSSSSPGTQPQPRTVKVTCANCKKPLKKGQTAYQRKGSTHLFCSTTCLSAFSHKPAPKKSCTMCKKDITNMKGTIVAQVDSSESFQEFCSTGCLGAYENKQNPPKSSLKTKCTVCGKLTEIRHEVSFKTVTHKICSDMCFNVYRRANGLIMNCCEQCGDYLPNRASANHFLLVDGQQKRFCCQKCIRDFKQAHSKLANCLTCKTLIKTGEVVLGLGADGAMGSYCSTNCMNKAKMAATAFHHAEPSCHFCKRNALPQYQATLPEGIVLNFCSSQCVTKFQNTSLQTATNGQTTLSTNNNNMVQLKCNYCKGAFSVKPETLEWEDKVYHFCSKVCCDDYKKLHCIVTVCEFCQEEKTLHTTANFSGEKKPFCSEGCKLLFKQDFIKRLGLKCVSCNHCSQMCKRSVTRQLGGMTRDFCGEACAKKFHDWYHKAARCDCCKVQGQLTESVMWRSEMKQFCDQQCLLRFYCQQNEPIMATQKGPENSCTGIESQTSKLGLVSQSTAAYTGGGLMRDVKNKAVLCKPLTLTKATYCKPHMQSKPIQTDVDDGVKREYVPVPIPVPVFIPMPMNMYSQLTPTPLSMPLPLPVPVFLPTTLQSTEQIVQTIQELRSKTPSAPVAAQEDPPSPTEVTSEDQKADVKLEKEASEREDEEMITTSLEEQKEVKKEGDVDLKKEEEVTEEEEEGSYMDLEEDFAQASASVPEEGEKQEERASRPQPRTRGSKRLAAERNLVRTSSVRSPPLIARYGVNAFRHWMGSAADPQASEPAPVNPTRNDVLKMCADELNNKLCGFVREVCRPNGDRYAPDSIFYLCLGIQKHLHANGQQSDIFSDSCYQEFGEELNKVLKDWKPSQLLDGSPWSRVDERCLWTGGHLGSTTPAVLLRSLVYLNAKRMRLRSTQQHLDLSFANVYGPDAVHPVTTGKSRTCVRVPSPVSQVEKESRKRKRDHQDCEDDDNTGSLGPVTEQERHLFQLYRSKCPALLLERSDFFYARPDPAWDGDGGAWFTTTPLEHHTLESLLARMLLVRDIYTDSQEQAEEEGGAE
ncbi:zinc finger MYM-type protein 2 isoform X1 [Hippocampus comes]|uniref:Zinc finger MYM-type containing 2 n=1 Tax=Hippocampus comes TaxID=109280 RepID=A0A3Q2YMI7_HIPCM|nr:PREDICTED: zinc finger MYM-type protein 2 isoform X1 [Hippocampus comes]XP_019735727.1 PREDICTED: zinc finger MYM-type protein 2 isoform X1 [Hippocampus comes]XP_019735736.1 PREDICTED: zinc finger MYM-type protein 2 isoform X1 [Hippocampus comes]